MALSFFYQNVRGLRSKTSTVFKNSLNSDQNIICLTETWLNNTISSQEVICDLYNVYRRDREDTACNKQEGGGVLIAVDKNLKSFAQHTWNSDAEDLWVTVVQEGNHNIKFHICCVYLPPGDMLALHTFCSKLSNITIENPDSVIVLCGDFNLPNIKWSLDPVNLFCKPHNFVDANSSLLIDTMSYCGLSQYNCHVNSSDNTLDLIYGNNNKISNLKICTSPLVPEDNYHNTLEFDLNIRCYRNAHKLNNVHLTYNFKQGNYDAINNELKNIDWNSEFSALNSEECSSKFYLIINKLIDMYIPMYPKCHRNFPHWYSVSTIKVIKEKKKYHRLWKQFSNKMDYLTFKLLRGRSKYLITQDYMKFVDACENNIPNNPKQIWQFTKSKRSNSSAISAIDHNNTLITDGLNICNRFSDYFSSVFNPPNSAVDLSNISKCNNLCISNYYISRETILDKIIALPDKAAGSDNIPTCFIKKCAGNISFPLHILFNKSLAEGYFPSAWKIAHIIPIYKSGNKLFVENYRPISKLCIIAKLFESIVFDYLYFDIKHILNPEQHGFLRKRSVDSNLFIYTEYILENLNNGLQVDAIYTDFSKAFDKIDHNVLLQKLADVGVDGNLLLWFKSYITNRTQAVAIGNVVSAYINISSGVPQGSHLGPLLFNIYTNDISNCFKYSNFLMYADDLKIFSAIQHTNSDHLIQDDLDRFFEYCQSNYLFLNYKKCHQITFSRNINVIDTKYKLFNFEIEKVSAVKDLGVLLDSKMTFNDHIICISKKAHKMLGFLIRTCHDFKQFNSFRMLYMAYVNSILSYGSLIWNPHYNIYINKLEAIQNKFVDFINKKLFPDLPNSRSLIKRKLGLISLEDRRQITDLKFVYKIVNNLIDCVSINNSIYYIVPSHNTRSKNLFYSSQANTNYYLYSPMHRCTKTYNSISNITEIDIFSNSLNTFTTLLKKFYFSRSVY